MIDELKSQIDELENLLSEIYPTLDARAAHLVDQSTAKVARFPIPGGFCARREFHTNRELLVCNALSTQALPRYFLGDMQRA